MYFGKIVIDMVFAWFQISINYNGRLKKNGELFDSNVGSAPYKFRLGNFIRERIMVFTDILQSCYIV